jgi:two-component system, OmpR family, sensor kinase
MSIRLRLALCYGALFALILPLVIVLSYAVHARGQYDDLDRTLMVSAEHAAAEATVSPTGPHLIQGDGGFEIALRLYTPAGILQERTVGTEQLPSVDPLAVRRAPAGPAFDTVTSLVPPLAASAPATPDAGSAFGLLTTSTQRWRVYVLPFHTANSAGYIEALTPLGRVDAAMQAFRLTLPLLGLASLLIALLLSWAIAGNALRPIATMIAIAQGIAQSRDLSRRVQTSSHHDELARLASTFNQMLESIETAYQAQQRFVADASHELRAPLTAISGNLELLHRHPTMPEAERAEALAEMTREADRLTRLVADLLALARADAGVPLKTRLVDLDAVVLDTFRSARQLAHGQTLVLDPFGPMQVTGDEDRLKQLLLILLDNALKYTPTGGQVTLGLCLEATSVAIQVRDTGVGIAPEDATHVFERFYRADPGRSRDPGGTGLGLPIAQWIVAQHAGTITLASQPGKGTCITIRLPLPGKPLHSPSFTAQSDFISACTTSSRLS